MKMSKNGRLWYFKWHMVLVYIAVIAMVVLGTLTDVLTGQIPQIVWVFVAIVVIISLTTMLVKVTNLIAGVSEMSEILERVSGSLEKSRAVLGSLQHDTRLSENAKSVVFRDADIQAIRELVFDKLQQQNFESTYEIIDDVAQIAGYGHLATQLRAEADRYRGATNQDRVKQVIANIEELLENNLWTKASLQIERLIADQPNSDEAIKMRQKLVSRKEERKKVLLKAWDDAINRQSTDRSLEILRELDMYLTPNEASALEEAARDVFRNKLHTMGVRFSLAVAAKEWQNALEAGQDIIKNFPNSKMAQEIRSKIDILKKRANKSA